MKTSSTWNLKSILGKMMLGFFLVSMIGSIDVPPAFAKDKYKRIVKHDNGRHRGHSYNRGRYVRVRRVYVSPPVVYVPPSPPGVQVFFPPVYIHP